MTTGREDRRTPAAPALVAIAVLLVTIGSVSLRAQDNSRAVLGSKHDLSAGGSGAVTSTETQACVFCHGSHFPKRPTPSSKVLPLWNRDLPVAEYDVYASSTLNAESVDLNVGGTKLCLGCHDGTIAPGITLRRAIATTGAMKKRAMGSKVLTQDHPVGIVPADDGQLVASLFEDPPETSDPDVKLYEGRIGCLTCHNPHEPDRDDVAKKFLVRSNSGGALCLSCHDPGRPQPNRLSGWPQSAHATATHTISGEEQVGPYDTVNANACQSCHAPHGGAKKATPRLLRAPEEQSCFSCHQGSGLSPTLPNLAETFSKDYAHPTVTISGVHDPAEKQDPVDGERHAECADCHSPHASAKASGPAAPPQLRASVAGASGYNGVRLLQPAAGEYEICFKCHADSPNKPQTTTGPGPYGWTALRQTDALAADPFNTRLEFQSNVSRHNVSSPRGGAGSNSTVPSLRTAIRLPNGSTDRSLAEGTYLYCTDCHNNNSATSLGGSAPDGPHGSDYEHLLALPYPVNSAPAFAGEVMREVNFSSGASTYPLCNTCHYIDRDEHGDALFNDRTFSHSLHIQGRGTSCATCHDSHGIQGGNANSNPSLINFDLKLVAPLPGMPSPRLESLGGYTGRCYLQCHSKRHDSQFY